LRPDLIHRPGGGTSLVMTKNLAKGSGIASSNA